MNLNAIYLAALAANTNVVAVEVYFIDSVAPTRAARAPQPAPVQNQQLLDLPVAPWQMDANATKAGDFDHKRRPAMNEPVQKQPREVFTYLAPKSYNLKEDDAVIVVNDRTGKVSVAYVHSVTGIDLDKLNEVASSYGYQHTDGHFWKWIVSAVNFEKYNDLNKSRDTFLDKAVGIESTKRATQMRNELVEFYGSASTVDDLFSSVLPGVEPKEAE